MGGAVFHPGRFAGQLRPHLGGRRRSHRRTAGRRRDRAERRGYPAHREDRAERAGTGRPSGLQRRKSGRAGDQLRVARQPGRSGRRDNRLPQCVARAAAGGPSRHRLLPDRRRSPEPRLRRRDQGRYGNPRADRFPDHCRCRGPSPAFRAGHVGDRCGARLRHQYDGRFRGLARHGVQPGQLGRADYRHDGCRRPLGPHRLEHSGGHGQGHGQAGGDCRCDPGQRLARVSHIPHHGDRLPQP